MQSAHTGASSCAIAIVPFLQLLSPFPSSPSLSVALTAGGGCTKSNNDDGSTSCNNYFDAIVASQCNSLIAPSDEARARGRFETDCTSTLALPGISVTASALDSCTAAIAASGCAALDATSGACAFSVGTLAEGAECITDTQCQSERCEMGTATTDAGSSACGKCTAVATAGQPCGTTGCGPNLSCSSLGSSSSTCVAITYGDSGAACNDATTQCKPGLWCDFTKMQCSPVGTQGSACSGDSSCAPPLICAGMTCQKPGTAGAACSADNDCVSGLGCDPSKNQCSAVTWATAGQPCGGNVRCTVGYCPDNSGQGGNGVCPTVIADGQACGGANEATTTCDTFSQCLQGTCTLGWGKACQ